MDASSFLHAFREYRSARRDFLSVMKPCAPLFRLAALCVVGLTTTNTLLIWLMGQPFDFLSKGQYQSLLNSLITIAVVVVANQITHLFNTYLANKVGLQLVGRIRNHLIQQFILLSTPVVQRYNTGDLLARMSHDVDRLQNLLIEIPLFFLSHVLTFVFYTSMLFFISWKLAIAAMMLAPLFLIQQQIFAAKKRKAAEKFYQANGNLLATEEEIVTKLNGFVSLNAGEVAVNRHGEKFNDALHWALRERWLDVLFTATVSLLVYGIGLFVLYLGVTSVMEGALSLGLLMSFLLYMGYLSVPVRGFVQIPFQLQTDLAATQRISELWQAKPIVYDRPDAEPLAIEGGKIEFRQVAFSYPHADPLFYDLSFTIEAGKTVALVGASGGGKSTILRLLLRFYDPDNGAILIDNQDLRNVSLHSLRDSVAVVWQQPLLLRDTFRNNLRLAKPDANDDELWQALTQAELDSVARESKNGLDEIIGAGATELSVGQQQRFAIAQAYLRNAPILVMDEASSALDSQVEQKVMHTLAKLRQNRTTLIIAHRYTSIRNADYVIYLNHDGTVSVGKHEELLQSHEAYREAVQWQAGESAV